MMNNKTSSKSHSKKKKAKKVKKKIEEAPPPDLTSENAKIEMIKALLQKTDLNEDELIQAYDDFYSKYPEGELNEAQFLRESKVDFLKLIPITDHCSSFSSGWGDGPVPLPSVRREPQWEAHIFRVRPGKQREEPRHTGGQTWMDVRCFRYVYYI